MKKFLVITVLSVAAYASACGGAPEVSTNEANLSSSVEAANTNGAANASNTGTGGELGVVSSRDRATSTSAPAEAAADKPPVATPELDEKVKKAVEKANAPGASAAAKKAAAEAYFERANFFRDAGNPRLYKFALADYRRGLRLDPNNRDAKAKMDEIVMIYEGMGKPVPQLGVEP